MAHHREDIAIVAGFARGARQRGFGEFRLDRVDVAALRAKLAVRVALPTLALHTLSAEFCFLLLRRGVVAFALAIQKTIGDLPFRLFVEVGLTALELDCRATTW